VSAQAIYIKDVDAAIDGIDEHVACVSREYMNYHRYKVGKKVNINKQMKLVRLRDILSNRCAVACLNVKKILEKINLR